VVLQSKREITLQACEGWVVWGGAATLCYLILARPQSRQSLSGANI